MILEICIALTLILCFIDLYFRYSRAGRLMGIIPGPKILPLIGNGLEISLNPELLFEFNRLCVNNYGGSVCRLMSLNTRVICIFDPEDLERQNGFSQAANEPLVGRELPVILRLDNLTKLSPDAVNVVLSSALSKFHEKPMPYTFLRSWLGEGLLMSSGSKWKHRRKLLTPAFHFNILKKFTQTFQEHAEELTEMIKSTGEECTHVMDLKPLITNVTFNMICETSMGISNIAEIGSKSNKYFQALQTLASGIIYRISKILYYSDFIFNLSETSRIQKKALEYLHGFTHDVIRNRRKCRVSTDEDESEGGVYGKKPKTAMLDLLLEQEDKGNIDAESIREEVDTFIFEGHDTTSSTLRFMLMRIANEPIIQSRIYEELTSIFGDSDRTATMDDLNEMKYLERCIKEALRLYPGVPFMARMLREETVLNGYTIPADTICTMHIFTIHRREKLFPNPEVFDPDRFLPENVVKRHPYAYIPFSAGPRNCIGQKFAMLEMKTVVSSLLRSFHLEPVTRPEDVVFVSDLTLEAKHPMYVRFIERNVL